MLASLILEGRGTKIQTSASISVIRFVNSGPQSLLLNLQPSWKHNWRSTGTILLLFSTTVLLQFTSTLLAFDLDNEFLIDPVRLNSTNTRISARNQDLAGSSTPLSAFPREIPIFAEYHEDLPEHSENESSSSTTGTLFRALLPFTSSPTRTSIKDFPGGTTLIDSTVACVRPRMAPEHTVGFDIKRNLWFFNES